LSAEPFIQAERARELSELQNEIAKLRPQMELAVESSRKAAQELRSELCKEEREIKQQTEKQRREVQRNLEHLRQQLRRMQQELL